MICMYDTLVNRILFWAESRPNKLAAAFKKDRLTYGKLAEKMRYIAACLGRMGIHKGDHVLFSAVSRPEMAAVYLGIQYCGGVAVFLDKNATPEYTALLYRESSAVLLLTDRPMKEYGSVCRIYSLKAIYNTKPDGAEGVASLEAFYTMPEESVLAELLFTTGTTGRPKGVMLTYKAVYHILKNTIEGIGIGEEERVLLPLPLNHSFALRVLRAVLYRGGSVIFQNGFTFAKEIENNLDEYQCTGLAVVPASIETISRQMQGRFAEIMGRFRYIEVSAGSLTVEQRKRLTKQLPDTMIYNTWGSSESGGALFLNVTEAVSDPEKVSSLGKPPSCVQLKILDETGNAISGDRSHPGRMAIKGDMQMSGYWGQGELTAETIKDGWLLTGDMAYLDEDGYVYMLGRADDIINVGGEKVSPVEIENIAGEYPYIRECACIGAPDPEGILGFVPVLFVVVKGNGYSEDDLQVFLKGRMERYKLPAKYISVQEIPRNQLRKIDRKKLREMWELKGSESLMNPVMQAILTRRSIRRFQERAIPREILDMILRAGYYAPSGHNMQTWQFTVVEDREKIVRLKEAALKAAKVHHVYCYGFENPACIVIISNDERNRDGCQDASCAAENIFLAAHSYGIGSVWLNMLMTLREKEPVKQILDEFGIPNNHVVWCMAALGYPLEEGVLLAKREDVVHFIE